MVTLAPSKIRRSAHLFLACLPLALAACDRPQVERVELGEVQFDYAEPIASPETEGAAWSVSEDKRAILFGQPDERPLLTLRCRAPEGEEPQLAVIRHAPAQPGAKALFAVIGNGMVARLYVDAALNENEWRWEGRFPADAPDLQVFTGPRDLEATLPGGGTLQIAGSTLPRDFVTWCRSLNQPEGPEPVPENPEPQNSESEAPQPDPSASPA